MNALPRFFEACPLCNGTTHAAQIDRGTIVFARCASCDLLYKSHAAADFQPDHGYCEYPMRHFEHRVARAERQIRSAQGFVAAKSVLDIGCGHGYAMVAGARLGLRATDVDVDADAVSACTAQGLDARLASAEALPLPDQSFDIVLMRHLLGHLRHPRLALAEVRRVLAPGGIVIVAVHDLAHLRVHLAGAKHKFFSPERSGPEHHTYYRAETLGRMLEDSGLSVRARSKAGFWQGLARLTRLRRELFFIAAR